jgi:hypothetical protein
MRSAVFAGAIFATVLASGCASTPGTNLGSPSASARATQPSSTAPSTDPTPGTPPSTCSKATPPDAAVVLTDWTHAPGYTVNLVAANGCVIASATARTWSGYSATAGQPVSLPTSESATRVYFLDGDSTLRFLGLDGSKGVAAQLPGSSNSKVAFSVSPDNTRLAFSVMSWGSDERHFTEQSYVEDLGTGAHRTELFTLTGGNVAEEPIGWINGDIVFGLLLSANQYGAGPTPPIFDAYHVANPLTGKRLATICAGSGNAWVFDGGDYTPLPSKTAVLCRVGDQYQPDGTLELVSWSGNRLQSLGDSGCASPAAASPGGVVAIGGAVNAAPPGVSCANGSGSIKVIANSNSRTLAVAGLVEGWMDDTHLVVVPFTSPVDFPWAGAGSTFPPLEIVDVNRGVTASSAVKGVFAGSVPTGM